MKSKPLLFLGIFALVLGILMRKMTSFVDLGLFLIVIGVLCKTVYIVVKIKNGEYRPGKEVLFLGLGLILFLSGLYMRKYDENLKYPLFMILSGLILKFIFIIRFIKKIKRKRTLSEKQTSL